MSEDQQAVVPVTEELLMRLTISRLSVQITEFQEVIGMYQRKVAELEAKVHQLENVNVEQEV